MIIFNLYVNICALKLKYNPKTTGLALFSKTMPANLVGCDINTLMCIAKIKQN